MNERSLVADISAGIVRSCPGTASDCSSHPPVSNELCFNLLIRLVFQEIYLDRAAMEPIKGLRVRNSGAGGATTASVTSTSHQCGGCGQMIKDRYLLQVRSIRIGSMRVTWLDEIHWNFGGCCDDSMKFGADVSCWVDEVLNWVEIVCQALDVYWHEDCLKCGCCDCRLGEVGSTLYTRANLILCKRDYLR